MADWKWQVSFSLLKHEVTPNYRSQTCFFKHFVKADACGERHCERNVLPETQQHNNLSQGSKTRVRFSMHDLLLAHCFPHRMKTCLLEMLASSLRSPLTLLSHKRSDWPVLHNFSNDMTQRKINSFLSPNSTAFNSNQIWQEVDFNCSPGIRNLITTWNYFIVTLV